MDFFHHNGVTYLLLVDYYSKFVEVKQMSTTTCALAAVLKDVYDRFGIPNEVANDPGPPSPPRFGTSTRSGTLSIALRHCTSPRRTDK